MFPRHCASRSPLCRRYILYTGAPAGVRVFLLLFLVLKSTCHAVVASFISNAMYHFKEAECDTQEALCLPSHAVESV